MQKLKTTDERRKKNRLMVSLNASMKEFSIYENKPAMNAKVVDLCEEGAGLTMKGALELGTIAKLALEIPGWDRFLGEFYKENATSLPRPFVALVEVVWLKAQGERQLGVKFVGVDESHRKALSRFIFNSLAIKSSQNN